MPNLKDIVQRVFDATDNDPRKDSYTDWVVRLVNDQYQRISSLRLWPFMQIEAEVTFYATVTAASGGAVSVIAQAGLRNLVGTGTAFAAPYEGQTFIDSSDNEFTIGAVESATSLYIDSNWSLSSTPTSYDEWSVEFRRTPLPVDCAEVLTVVNRDDDEGIVRFLDRKSAERAYLDRDDSGTISVAIDDERVVDRSPVRAPTVTAGTTAGATLRVSTEYEYRYTIFWQGRESAPSPAKTVTTGAAANPSVAVSALEDLSYYDGVGTRETYRRKRIYRRDVTNAGPWLLVGTVAVSSTTTFADVSEVPTTFGELHGMTVADPATPRRYLRVWPAPSSNQTMVVRYLRTPKPLVGDSDVPVWPTRYHHLISYFVIAEVAASRGGTATSNLFKSRADELLDEMLARELTEAAREVRKGMMGTPYGRRWNVYGTPSIS